MRCDHHPLHPLHHPCCGGGACGHGRNYRRPRALRVLLLARCSTLLARYHLRHWYSTRAHRAGLCPGGVGEASGAAVFLRQGTRSCP